MTEHGRHEFPPDAPAPRRLGLLRGGRTAAVFGVLGVLLCVLLGVAIVTQARHTQSGDSLESARPADLVVLLDSLQQREATLNREVGDLQRTLAALRASGSDDKAAIADAQARLSALSILIGTVAATGPGVTLTIDDPAGGVAPETMIDVINELRAAGAEAMEIRGGRMSARVGVDTWVVANPSGAAGPATSGSGAAGPATSGSGAAGPATSGSGAAGPATSTGALSVDGQTLSPPYTVVAIGDPPTLAAAMTIPGGAVDSVERVGGTMNVAQSDHVDITALRQPKQRQYAQPGK